MVLAIENRIKTRESQLENTFVTWPAKFRESVIVSY